MHNIIIVDGQKFIDEDNSTNREGPSKGVHKQATSKLGFVKKMYMWGRTIMNSLKELIDLMEEFVQKL
jgi:hypothetical protein